MKKLIYAFLVIFVFIIPAKADSYDYAYNILEMHNNIPGSAGGKVLPTKHELHLYYATTSASQVREIAEIVCKASKDKFHWRPPFVFKFYLADGRSFVTQCVMI